MLQVSIVDSYVEERKLCLVLEYCEGGDLAAFLATRRVTYTPAHPHTDAHTHYGYQKRKYIIPSTPRAETILELQKRNTTKEKTNGRRI